MHDQLFDRPLLVFAVAFAAMWLASVIGEWLHGRNLLRRGGGDKDFDLIAGTSLSLLALLIGFTFSMAANRYDERKIKEEAEANAIGTEMLRAEFLPPADAARVRVLLGAYLDQRILFFGDAHTAGLARINQQTNLIQKQLWTTVRAAAAAQPAPVAILTASGMNDVLNSRGYTQAAIWDRIPKAAWALMMSIALLSNLLLGYGSGDSRAWKRLGLIMPLAVSISFLLIADLDAPRHGLIRVRPENLQSLAHSLGR
jgi:hypothetical protein